MLNNHEPLAIIGMGCRFPGGITNPDGYWSLLKEGRDAIIETPADRWDWRRFYDPNPDTPGKVYVNRGGFLQEPFGYFDASFFDMSPREAAILDPQQRLLLEVTWEAIENAGFADHVKSLTGVYIGAFTLDNMLQQMGSLNRQNVTTHTGVSASLSMLANRIAFNFDLRGPSIAIDTACSSSLVSLHMACQALWHGECEQAIAGGVNMMFRPEMLLAMCKGRFISPDALCQAFDENANGYIRGEGAGVVILKPLSKAQAAGDRIHALICATQVNQDGRTAGITLPNSEAQYQLMIDVIAKAGITPSQIDYVEAHGTGTQAGDAAEAEALDRALSIGRAADDRCWIGSVKTNLGHLEGVAGIAGVIKTVLCLQHQALPPHLNFKKLNPKIEFKHLRLPLAYQQWEGSYAGVNSFGYGGTNAHAILKVAPARQIEKEPETENKYLLPLSARSQEALDAQIQQHVDYLTDNSDISLRDYGYTLARRRVHHPYRTMIAAQSRDEALSKLQDMKLIRGSTAFANQNRLTFVFTGMGTQWWGMGAELMREHPVFCQTVLECDRIFRKYADFSLADLFREENGQPMGEPKFAQPANFAMQVGLLALWQAYGVTPAAVVGHSVGEISAAYAAGSLTLEDALKITYYRSQLMQRTAGQGMMLAVGLGEADVRGLIQEMALETQVSLAAINSPRATTLSGEPEALRVISAVLGQREIFNSFLKLEVAYHSHQMAPLEAEFMQSTAGVQAGIPTLPLYSTVTGKLVQGGEQDQVYWWQNASQPVLMQNALLQMIEDGYCLFLEVGPHPVLATSIQECLAARNAQGFCVPSLRRKMPERSTMEEGLAALYAEGYEPDWHTLYPTGNLIELPAYPWQRSYFWEEDESLKLDRVAPLYHPLAQLPVFAPVPTWEGYPAELAYLADHQIEENAIFPAAGYVEAFLAVVEKPATLENLEIRSAIYLAEAPVLHITMEDQQCFLYSRPGHQFREWTPNARARVLSKPLKPRHPQLDLDALRVGESFDVETIYMRLKQGGYHYGKAFRGMRQIWQHENQVLAQIVCDEDLTHTLPDYFAHPTLLDACLQSVNLLVPRVSALFLPTSIQQVRYYDGLPAEVWCSTTVTYKSRTKLKCDLVICNSAGQTLMELIGACWQALPKHNADEQPGLLYHLDWQPQPLSGTAFVEGVTLLFADQMGLADQMIASRPDHRWIRVEYGTRFGTLAPDHFVVNPDTDWAELIPYLPPIEQWLYLWELDALGTADVLGILNLIKALPHQNSDNATSHLTIVTRQQGEISPGQMMLWGLARVISNEHAWLSTRMIAWDGLQLDVLMNEIFTTTAETEILLCEQERFIHRLVAIPDEPAVPVPAEQDSAFALGVTHLGSFENIYFSEIRRRAPAQGEIEVRLHSSAVNFKDIMKLMNLLPQSYLDQTFYQSAIGLEGVGTIVTVGEGVQDWQVGDEVVVFAPEGTFRSFVTLDQKFILPKPKNLTFEQSLAFIPFITAYYALHHVARLQPGERVLLHSATGGVGLAAIQVARWLGAEIYATAGTPEKRDYLHSIGIQHVSDSRSLQFVDDIRSWTDGVDVVLNTLTGDGLLKSLELLVPYGRFIEIGKRDISENNSLAMGVFDANLMFTAIDLDRILSDRLPHYNKTAREVVALFEQGTFQPLPTQVYQSDTIQDAFRLMGQSRHIGKVVVNLTPPSQMTPLPASILHPEGSYLVTGGLSGLGLETAKWLAEAGARTLHLVGRSGANTPAAQAAVAMLRAKGVEVQVIQADISDRAQFTALIEQIKPTLRGIFHSAMVLDDDAMINLDAARVEKVVSPKAHGAWYLHEATCDLALDFFVLYSSVSAYIGNPRQANYAAANAFLDGLAHYRRAQGLPAISINWGSIAEVGVVARNPKVEQYLSQLGLRGIAPQLAMQMLEKVLHDNPVQITVMDIDWQKWANNPLIFTDSSLYIELTRHYSQQQGQKKPVLVRLLENASEDALQIVLSFLIEKIAKVTHIPVQRIDTKQRLERLGFDSLMGIELHNLIRTETGIELSVMTLMRGLSVHDLAMLILEKLQIANPELKPVA